MELYHLYALTSSILIKRFFKELNRIAFVCEDTKKGISFASSLDASFQTFNGGFSKIFVLNENNFSETLNNLLEYDPQIVVLIFLSDGYKDVLEEFMIKLAENELDSNYFLCEETMKLGILKKLIRNDIFINYVDGKAIEFYTYELNENQLEFKMVNIDDSLPDGYFTSPIEEFPITKEHSKLVKRYKEE